MTCLSACCGFYANAAERIPSAGALFEETVLADNAIAVRNRAALLDDPKRYDLLLNWVLSPKARASIRMRGDFTQTKPAPRQQSRLSEEHLSGGRIVSPVFDLLDVAKRLHRLADLVKTVDTIPEPRTEEQQAREGGSADFAAFRTGKHGRRSQID